MIHLPCLFIIKEREEGNTKGGRGVTGYVARGEGECLLSYLQVQHNASSLPSSFAPLVCSLSSCIVFVSPRYLSKRKTRERGRITLKNQI